MDKIFDADIVIGGGGLAGLTLALALRHGLRRDRSAVTILVADPALDAPPLCGCGATAILAGARRMLEEIGLWPQLESLAEPVRDITITGSTPRDGRRPTLLTFSDSIEAGQPLAHVIEDREFKAALLSAAGTSATGATEIRLRPLRLESATTDTDSAVVRLADGTVIRTALVVAADGAASRLRLRAGIGTTGWDHDHSVIVATTRHDGDHQGRAEEQFLSTGRAELLPLRNRRSALLWSQPRREAEYLVSLSTAGFEDEIERRIESQRGRLTLEGSLRALPLSGFVARSFIAERLALVGDAAHVIPPVAGLGLNLSLTDVAALAEVIVDAARLGFDIGSHHVLERYQRWRRFDTVATGLTATATRLLLSDRSRLGQAITGFGFGLLDRAPMIRAHLARHAAGITAGAPRLLRGQAL
ncbi:MAG: FAD-dependent monooxygenase [Alphaproteobacteria bacterium]|nr:FAD-dependent monooxygenase [Alphaproteobacteria bacterium]